MDEKFIPPTRFEANGFVIRSYTEADGSALSDAVNSSYEHLRPWMPWATPNQSVEVSEARCRWFHETYMQKQDFILGIWHDQQLLGGTGFHLRHGPIESGNAEIGMWIRQSAAGTGLGTRALQAMLEWGFTQWGWHRLVWKCDSNNAASIRVAEKCGLTLEGTLRQDAFDATGNRRDTRVYAILAGEWSFSISQQTSS